MDLKSNHKNKNKKHRSKQPNISVMTIGKYFDCQGTVYRYKCETSQ